jgi:diguanylate cyclase (GGDEF)-like protein/PAS domain S-box-containing protein
MTGYSAAELNDVGVGSLIHPEDVLLVNEMIEKVLSGDRSANRFLCRLVIRDGQVIVVEASASAIHAGEQTIGIQAIVRDVTERVELEEQLAKLAYHDALTALPNRARFLDMLESALADGGKRGGCTVFFLDLDNFKVLNDSLGHDVGDRALVEIARRVAAQLRGRDIVARFGGDEFVVLLHDVAEPTQAIQIAERVLAALGKPFELAGRSITLTASLGIAVGGGGERPEDLLRRADLAMYRGKDAGRNCYALHEHGMDEIAMSRLDLEHELRRAIAEHELDVAYQPIIDMRSGGIAGVEALVRWPHPSRGLLLPGAFVHIAEETGLIVELDRWVMRQAWSEMRRIEPDGNGGLFKVCVNVSARHLEQPDLVEFITELLVDGEPHPARLVVELTETAMMRDVGGAQQALRTLRERGVEAGLDDFGMGYSSLARIRRFQIGHLKIAQQFISEMSESDDDLIIVSGMIELAHALGLKVVAEGVETATQVRLLAQLGCDFAQGYFFGRPMPAEAFNSLLANAPSRMPSLAETTEAAA